MKILYLGYPENSIHLFLKTRGNVTNTQEKLSSDIDLKEFEWIISYGYSHIIKQEYIDQVKNPIINLHVSYLPFNKGADPNFWSWFENTPKGVTIHQIDKGIDTGGIFIQNEVKFKEDETLASSYEILRKEIENLFIESFDNIVKGIILPKNQNGDGTFHLKKDLDKYKHLFTQSWNTPVNQIKMTDLEIINEIQKVRGKNNVNWMDILRIAFTHAPEETREVFKRITNDDNIINKLSKQLSNNK
jgi:folate-dependent phosphoribosylglycinamide formyltransferase PurN